MSKKHPRVIGTGNEQIVRAESELGFKFPHTFRKWLLENNGRGIEDITIFPVFDERDSRKTFDSIVRNYRVNWLTDIERFKDEAAFAKLLPFAEFGSGDFFCFDYSDLDHNGEAKIVLWSHENGEPVLSAHNFEDFMAKLENEELEY